MLTRPVYNALKSVFNATVPDTEDFKVFTPQDQTEVVNEIIEANQNILSLKGLTKEHAACFVLLLQLKFGIVPGSVEHTNLRSSLGIKVPGFWHKESPPQSFM